MLLIHCDSVAELNELASDMIIKDLGSRPESLVCAATGNSPTGIYQLLAEKKDSINVKGIGLLKLDEWYGLPMDHPATCEHYLQKYLIQPLGLTSYTAFDSKAADPTAECRRINQYLEKNEPVDLCILGLGQNGHIAFNEPADFLQPYCHLALLSKASLTHTMIQNSGVDLKYGFTLGMADILKSKKIILPVFGKNKQEIMARLLEGKVSAQLPRFPAVAAPGCDLFLL